MHVCAVRGAKLLLSTAANSHIEKKGKRFPFFSVWLLSAEVTQQQLCIADSTCMHAEELAFKLCQLCLLVTASSHSLDCLGFFF
jgi:hypothetical protein